MGAFDILAGDQLVIGMRRCACHGEAPFAVKTFTGLNVGRVSAFRETMRLGAVQRGLGMRGAVGPIDNLSSVLVAKGRRRKALHNALNGAPATRLA